MQAAFVREYVVDTNASGAAKRAGYSEDTADTIGSSLMKKPSVKAAIDKRLVERSQRLEIRADEVLRALAELAFFDPGDVIDFTGEDSIALKRPCDIPAAARRGITSIKVKRYVEGKGESARQVEVVELKFVDKLEALSKCMRHLGLYKDRISLEVILGTLPTPVAGELRRLLARDLQS